MDCVVTKMYYKIIQDGYTKLIGSGSKGIEITEAEYNHIKSVVDNRPTAPDGFGYRLTESLEWELYELPIVEEIDEATETDYQNALRDMGVNV